MSTIYQVKLPNGSIFDIEDRYAREAIAGGVSFIRSTTAANTPKDVTWLKDGVPIVGTLEAVDAAPGAFYLVPSKYTIAGEPDAYGEYVSVTISSDPLVKNWEKMGDTEIDFDNLGDLAWADDINITLSKDTDVVLGEATTFTDPARNISVTGTTTDKVLGADTTFTNSSSNVSFATNTTKAALGANATFDVDDPTVDVTPTITHVKATASGTAISTTGGDALTSLGTPTTVNFVKSYPGTTNNMVTTSITPTDGTVDVPVISSNTTATATNTVFGTDATASHATAGTAVAVATTGTQVTNVVSGFSGAAPSGATGNNGKILYGMNVADGILSFGYADSSTSNITPATSNGTITPYTFTDVTVPQVTSNNSVSATNTSFGTATKAAKLAASPITVATGSLASTGTGASVMTGLGTAATEAAITAIEPSKTAFLKTAAISTQPTITLASNASGGTGIVDVVTGITSAQLSTTTVSATTKDSTTAITALGAATAAAQTITVGTNDRVDAVTALGTLTDESHSITVSTDDKVTVLKNTTDVTHTIVPHE